MLQIKGRENGDKKQNKVVNTRAVMEGEEKMQKITQKNTNKSVN